MISHTHKINDVEKMFGEYTEVYVLHKMIFGPHK